jgi:ribosomal protein S18 acetylase RimI-like enzyme
MPQSRQMILRVRLASPRDANLLAELAARLFEEAFGSANTPDDMQMYVAKAFSPKAQRDELSDPMRVVWIAEDPDGAPIGYAMLRRGGTAPGVDAVASAEVQRIYVDRAWHGRGAASALMGACADQAREWAADVLWLGVWERNPRAIAFYEKMGFRVVGKQTFLLGRDVQFDLVMARDVSSITDRRGH